VGVQMTKVALGAPNRTLLLDHCSRCGGVWFEKGEAGRLALHAPSELWKHIPPTRHVIKPPCHGCGTPLARGDAACGACSRANRIACPQCDEETERVAHDGLTLDVCRRCKGVWFDHAEIESIWRLNLVELGKRRNVSAADDGATVLLESLMWFPDLAIYGTYAVASGVAEAAGAVADGAVAVGAEAAGGGVIEVVGNAAEGVFGAIADIIGGIFEGLG
jgi:Zn-finger nucleic acid-binding protein